MLLVGKEPMPHGNSSQQSKHKTLAGYINNDLSDNKKFADLSTNSLNLLDLLTLVVDIEYRHKYGHPIDENDGNSYSKQHSEVLADQLPPVEEAGSARLSSTGDNCHEA